VILRRESGRWPCEAVRTSLWGPSGRFGSLSAKPDGLLLETQFRPGGISSRTTPPAGLVRVTELEGLEVQVQQLVPFVIPRVDDPYANR
jgi:hypothetical protein